MIGHCYVNCKNKQLDPEYTGNENYLKCLDFNLLYASAMVQALPSYLLVRLMFVIMLIILVLVVIQVLYINIYIYIYIYTN